MKIRKQLFLITVIVIVLFNDNFVRADSLKSLDGIRKEEHKWGPSYANTLEFLADDTPPVQRVKRFDYAGNLLPRYTRAYVKVSEPKGSIENVKPSKFVDVLYQFKDYKGEKAFSVIVAGAQLLTGSCEPSVSELNFLECNFELAVSEKEKNILATAAKSEGHISIKIF